MAATAKYCRENNYEHWFWTITESGSLALRQESKYKIIDLAAIGADTRMFKMIADQKLHYIMRGDILRFVIDYLYGGYYADIDTVIMNLQDSFLNMDYVCGYERPRQGAGSQYPEFTFENQKRPRQDNVVCTGFFGAPRYSLVNKAVADFILEMYENIARTGRYPQSMWDVLDFTGPDMYARILSKFPNVVPFPMETFFPYPFPSTVAPFTIHYYAGTEPGGWTFDHCKNEECPSCKEKTTCKISRHGRR